jgi:hypothetical protein
MKSERKKMSLAEAAEEARSLAEQLFRDVEQAGNREDHIRMTARANEADTLAKRLEELNVSSQAASPIV